MPPIPIKPPPSAANLAEPTFGASNLKRLLTNEYYNVAAAMPITNDMENDSAGIFPEIRI